MIHLKILSGLGSQQYFRILALEIWWKDVTTEELGERYRGLRCSIFVSSCESIIIPKVKKSAELFLLVWVGGFLGQAWSLCHGHWFSPAILEREPYGFQFCSELLLLLYTKLKAVSFLKPTLTESVRVCFQLRSSC